MNPSQPLEKPGAGLEENGARGKKRRTATSKPRKRAELSRGQRNTGLTDSSRRASVQAWDEFAVRCRTGGKGKGKVKEHRGGFPALLSRAQLVRLHAIYRRGYSVGELSEIFGLPWYPIWSGFVRHGLKRRPPHGCHLRGSIRDQVFDDRKPLTFIEIEAARVEFLKLPKGRAGCRGYGEHVVCAMYADYLNNGEIVAAVAKRWKRSPGAIKEILKARGLRQTDPERTARIMKYQRVHGTGCFAKIRRATNSEIDALVARATKITIPDALRLEFKSWPMAKRAMLLSKLRAKVNLPDARPAMPFSKNVRPFDYATPEARAIKDKLNAGKNSREAICKIDFQSQGVIYEGELWFWSPKTGYNKRGIWTQENGRPLLHRVIWEKANGRKVPPQHAVRFADGNQNNLLPENLILAHKNDICREVQAKWLWRKSRERTALLLQRAQGKEKHGLIEELSRAA